MALFTRTQEVKQLVPGLNAIFGFNYNRYGDEHKQLFDTYGSDKAFEEDVLFSELGLAPVKTEGANIAYDVAREGWVARYTHETIALGFAITEEAMEDNLYQSVATRLSAMLGQSMARTKQTKAAAVYNNAFTAGFTGGDGVVLASTAHPLLEGGTFSNRPTNGVDLSQTALEDALIAIAGFVNERGAPVAIKERSLVIPRQLYFVACRLLKSPLDPESANNAVNAIYQTGMFPEGYHVNHWLTDSDQWQIRTDCPDGMKHFQRVGVKTKMEGDFESGNMRYKARERYIFGWSNPRAVYISPGN